MRGAGLEDSEIDPLDLSDELKDFARQMAGESSVSLTTDREHILLTAALDVELYSARCGFGAWPMRRAAPCPWSKSSHPSWCRSSAPCRGRPAPRSRVSSTDGYR